MTIGLLVLRLLRLWTLAFWLGGFTFYTGVVIPILHDQLGSPLETGLVTQRATDVLNWIGVALIGVGWVATQMERAAEYSWHAFIRWQVGAFAVMTVSQSVLLILHRVLDLRLAAGKMAGFYPIHRVYVWTSTLQWAAGMILLASWAVPGRQKGTHGAVENPQVLR